MSELTTAGLVGVEAEECNKIIKVHAVQEMEEPEEAAVNKREGSRGVFGIEEPLSIFSIHIENIEFFNIDFSIYGSSILRNIENIEDIENVDMSH
jgi:hypothetical protein